MNKIKSENGYTLLVISYLFVLIFLSVLGVTLKITVDANHYVEDMKEETIRMNLKNKLYEYLYYDQLLIKETYDWEVIHQAEPYEIFIKVEENQYCIDIRSTITPEIINRAKVLINFDIPKVIAWIEL